MRPHILALLVFATGATWAAEPVAGDWIGTLKPGNVELRLLLHVKQVDGKLAATLDSIDQGAKGIGIDTIAYAEPNLKFDINQIDGHYEGKYDAAKKTISGTWTQGPGSFPLEFTPHVEKPKPVRTGPPAKPSDIDGDWEGTLTPGGQTLRVVFHIKTDENGELTATTDSPDQNAFGLPVSAVKRDGAKLHIEIKGVGATYDGTVNDAKTKVEGTLTQGGELPLVLERKPAEKPKG